MSLTDGGVNFPMLMTNGMAVKSDGFSEVPLAPSPPVPVFRKQLWMAPEALRSIPSRTSSAVSPLGPTLLSPSPNWT